MMLNKLHAITRHYFSSFSGFPAAVRGAFILSLIEALAIGVNCFLSLYFIGQYHLSVELIGMLLSSYGCGTIVGGYLGGRLADVIHPRKVAMIGLLTQALGYGLLAHTNSLPLIAVILFIIGIGSYAFITSNHLWVLSNCADSQRYKALSILDVTANAGLGLAGMLVGFLSVTQFPRLFNAAAVMMVGMSVYLAFLGLNIRSYAKRESQSVGESKANARLMMFALFCVFCAGLLISQNSATYPVYLHSLFPSMDMTSFGILFTINTFMVVLLQAEVTKQLQNKNKILLAGVGVLLLGLGFATLIFAKYFVIAIIAVLISTFGEMIFFPIAQLLCYESGAESSKGASLGNYRAIYALSRFAGPAMGGYIYQHAGGESLWLICLMIGLLCVVTAFAMRKAKIHLHTLEVSTDLHAAA